MSYPERENLIAVAISWTLVGVLFGIFILNRLGYKGDSPENNVSGVVELTMEQQFSTDNHRAE